MAGPNPDYGESKRALPNRPRDGHADGRESQLLLWHSTVLLRTEVLINSLA
jgi:hypothetical protein